MNKNLPTIVAFKQEAKNYKEQSQEKITHSQALNEIANKYGYRNYMAIKNKLNNKNTDILSHEDKIISNYLIMKGDYTFNKHMFFPMLNKDEQLKIIRNLNSEGMMLEVITDNTKKYKAVINITDKEFYFKEFTNLAIEEKSNYILLDFNLLNFRTLNLQKL